MYHLQNIAEQLQQEGSSLFLLMQRAIQVFYRHLERIDEKMDISSWYKELHFLYGDLDALYARYPEQAYQDICMQFGLQKPLNFSAFLGSIQTFYSLLVRLIAWDCACAGKKIAIEKMRIGSFFRELCNGTLFRRLGIQNYCQIDWYSWIIMQWDQQISDICQQLLEVLCQEDILLDPDVYQEFASRDCLKTIYEVLLPHPIRHALGEFYTPGWLANWTLQETVQMSGGAIRGKRILDPTCGSGIFLVQALKLLRDQKEPLEPDVILGYDIHPLAVLTAKTNYLIAEILFLEEYSNISIPIYEYDVLNPPRREEGALIVPLLCGKEITLGMKLYQEVVGLGTAMTPEHFLRLYHNKALCKQEVGQVIDRILAFAKPPVDILVGNPPWVNWEYLSAAYREKSRTLWQQYGFMRGKGRGIRYSKEDISALVTYLSIDCYLQPHGHAGLILRQQMFKSAQNGAGFRQFQMGEQGCKFCILRVEDLAEAKPFENKGSQTAIVLLQRDSVQTFPVPYAVWRRDKGFHKALRQHTDPRACLKEERLSAYLSDPMDKTSVWITVSDTSLPVIHQVLGKNEYQARTGVFTGGANAIYHIAILKEISEKDILIENQPAAAKRKVASVQCVIEKTYVYPFLRGSDLQQWQSRPHGYCLLPHTQQSAMWPIVPEILSADEAKTYQYFQKFCEALADRKGFAGWEHEIYRHGFYGVLRVGTYTFAKYKVAWRYIAQRFICAVISTVEDPFLGTKLCIPNEKLIYISTEQETEAYYLCGVLSSDFVAQCVQSYMNPMSISVHVLEKLNIPTFEPLNPLHLRIAALCKQGHLQKTPEIQHDLNQAVHGLYGF